MSPNKEMSAITKDNLDAFLKDLGKEYRKLAGKKMPAEIVLVGGAAVLAKYGFRELTYDIDAIIFAASAMKDAISQIRYKYNLPHDWLNADFRKTTSYTDKLLEVSVYYKTFSNILTIRTITAEYLLAMKLMSGRTTKYDLSDIVGILWEHQKENAPISRKAVENAILLLYGNDVEIPETSVSFMNSVFDVLDYEALYHEAREAEIEAKQKELELRNTQANLIKEESVIYNIDTRNQEHYTAQKQSLLKKLEEKRTTKT